MPLTLTIEARVLNSKKCRVRGSSPGGGYFFFLEKKNCRHFDCRHYVLQPVFMVDFETFFLTFETFFLTFETFFLTFETFFLTFEAFLTSVPHKSPGPDRTYFLCRSENINLMPSLCCFVVEKKTGRIYSIHTIRLQ